MELTSQEKLRLINFFEFLLNEEISKPLGEMNPEAVDNYIKILLHLQDKHIELSSEFINEQVRKIFHPNDDAVPETAKTTKKYFNKKKIWLVAACIAILVALFSFVSVAYDWNVFDFLSEKFGSVHSAPIEDSVNYNGITITNHGKSSLHKTIDEALKSEKIDVLYPSSIPNNISITDIMIYEENSQDKLIYLFSDPELFATISFNTRLSKTVKDDATETMFLRSITYYICEMPDISSVQVEFEYRGNTYMFKHKNKELLIEIIENLEEINYEN